MLPRECYLNMDGSSQVQSEQNHEQYYLDHIQSKYGTLVEREFKLENGQIVRQQEWYDDKAYPKVSDDGIYVYIQGAQFPLKGAPPLGEVIFSINIVKALFIEAIKTFSSWYFILGALFVFLSTKKIQNILNSFNRLSWKVVSPHVLKDAYFTPFDKAFHFTIFTFLYGLGLDEKSCDITAKIFTHVISHDNAYRLRLQDIFSETSLELLENPRKEIKRLGKLITQRDVEGQVVKAQKIIKIFRLALLVPRIRKAFKSTVEVIDLKELKFDESDKYWVCIRKDCNFMGMTLEQRQEYAKTKGWYFPNQIKVI